FLRGVGPRVGGGHGVRGAVVVAHLRVAVARFNRVDLPLVRPVVAVHPEAGPVDEVVAAGTGEAAEPGQRLDNTARSRVLARRLDNTAVARAGDAEPENAEGPVSGHRDVPRAS